MIIFKFIISNLNLKDSRVKIRKMFKVLLLWLLSVYSLDIGTKTYSSLTKENTFREMKEYMYSCQVREDKLREQCDLKMYRIVPDQGLLENLIDSCYIKKNYYLANTMSAETYELFMEMSYDKTNVGSLINFEDTSYTLLREGQGGQGGHSYREPLWSIRLNDHTLTISSIK